MLKQAEASRRVEDFLQARGSWNMSLYAFRTRFGTYLESDKSYKGLLLDDMLRIHKIFESDRIFTLLPLLAASILLTHSFSPAIAQSLVPGIHAMSIVQGVKFTWVIISSEKEISVNLRYAGNSTTPAVTLVATALTNSIQANQTNDNQSTSTAPTTMGGSQIMNAGWQSPSSITIKIEGNSSLYDADLVTVVASPYTGG